MKKFILAALGAGALAGCQHMQVPAELKADPLPIEEKPGLFSGNLRFGPFQARDIDKSWVHGGSSTVRWFGTSTTSTDESQDFSFRFLEQGQPERVVACRAAFKGDSSAVKLGKVTLTSGEAHSSLDCKFGPPGADAPEGILRFADAGPGRLDFHETVFEVAATDQFEGGGHAGSPIGYVVTSSGRPVAAVDANLISAWMQKDLPAALRTGAGLGATIFLLYKPQAVAK